MFALSTQNFLLSLAYVMVEKVLLLGQIFEMEVLADLHVITPPETENHILRALSACSHVCLCVCLYVFYQRNLK